MNDIILTETSKHKDLGLNFSSSCIWIEDINRITETALTRLNLMNALKFKINKKIIRKLSVHYLNIAISVWDNCTNESKEQLDLIHHEAGRIITGTTKLSSTEKLLADLGWGSLQERGYKHKLTIFFKISNGLACTPRYLSEVLSPLVQEINPYNLRNANVLHPMHANTNLFFNSFFHSTIRAWNQLSEEIKEANTVSAL